MTLTICLSTKEGHENIVAIGGDLIYRRTEKHNIQTNEVPNISKVNLLKMAKQFSGKPEFKLKIWRAIYFTTYLTALALPVALSNENNYKFHPIIHADEVHIINDTVELLCTMHGDNKNLTFYQRKSGDQFDLIYENVNDTTIRHVTEADKGPKVFFCEDTMTTKKAIKIIEGGILPTKVEDFRCISYNFKFLNCTWIGADTGLLMEYEAYQDTPTYKHTKTIKATILDRMKRLYSCSWVWGWDASPRYQIIDGNFEIGLIGSNGLGKHEEVFAIDHYSIVKPNPPINLKSFNESTHETTLSWKIDERIKNFLYDPLVINIEVNLKSDDFEKVENKTFVLQEPKPNDVIYMLKDLPYAHFMYRVRVSIKPVKASDKFWSDSADIYFNTTSEIPKPPNVPPGLYYESILENRRQITLYWKKLSKFEHGGNNFLYRIDVLGVSFSENYNTTFGFIKIDVPLEDVHVLISSENEEGRSNATALYIRSVEKINIYSAFTKHKHNNGSHFITWSYRDKNPDNFTIIWCKFEIKNECKDFEYTILNGDKRNYTIDLPEGNYQFAISANHNDTATGLNWTV